MSESTWTNSTIRKRLGESGFIQVKDRDEKYDNVLNSWWQRGENMLLLIEHEDGPVPQLFDMYGRNVNVEELGVRNENTQTGNHP